MCQGQGRKPPCSSWQGSFARENTSAAAPLRRMGPGMAACPGKHQWCCWVRGAQTLPSTPAWSSEVNPSQSSSWACPVWTGWTQATHSAQGTDLVALCPPPESGKPKPGVTTRPQATSWTCLPSLSALSFCSLGPFTGLEECGGTRIRTSLLRTIARPRPEAAAARGQQKATTTFALHQALQGGGPASLPSPLLLLSQLQLSHGAMRRSRRGTEPQHGQAQATPTPPPLAAPSPIIRH